MSNPNDTNDTNDAKKSADEPSPPTSETTTVEVDAAGDAEIAAAIEQFESGSDPAEEATGLAAEPDTSLVNPARENAHKLCGCGATLGQHSVIRPYPSLVPGSACKAFLFLTPG